MKRILARLAEVKSRLLLSELPFAKLAASCGFANSHYLKKLLLARFGTTLTPLMRR